MDRKLDLTTLNVTPEIQDILADTVSQILKIGFYEMSGEAWSTRTYDFAWSLPNMLLQYGFTTIDELNEPSILEYTISVPEPEDEHGTISRAIEQDNHRD